MDLFDKVIEKAIWPVTLFISGLIAKLFKQSSALKKLNLATAQKDIIGLYEKARDRGFTTPYEYTTMKNLITNYYELGGNSFVHKIEAMYDLIEVRTDPLDKEYEKKSKE